MMNLRRARRERSRRNCKAFWPPLYLAPYEKFWACSRGYRLFAAEDRSQGRYETNSFDQFSGRESVAGRMRATRLGRVGAGRLGAQGVLRLKEPAAIQGGGADRCNGQASLPAVVRG